ncbi:MAG TPA: AI-2E family transporter [Epulopiscium sp.]|nr:AI-2E family transporter [Candidatus Epulonipiscium sp.]
MNGRIKSKYFQTALYVLFIVIAAILFYHLLGNIGAVGSHLKAIIKVVTQVLSPLLYGLLFAFLMSPGVNFFEEKIYLITGHDPLKNKIKSYRSLSILLIYMILFGFVFFVIQYMVPQILSNLIELYTNVPSYIASIESAILALEETMDYASQYLPQDYLIDFLNMLQPAKLSPAFITTLVGRILFGALNFTSLAFNIILGCVISFYLLKQKDDFAKGAIRLIYAICPKDNADKLIGVAKESNYIFARFFIGKSLDSLIIGMICFVGLTLLGNRYALLLSLIVGVTNMIPYFGPFIGGIPAVLITLFEGFLPALFVVLFILALQQFDGLYLGPKILGDSIGLSPFWIITSILIGGALWGTLGMFFGAPLCAIILMLVNRWIDRRLEYKNIILDEPIEDELETE